MLARIYDKIPELKDGYKTAGINASKEYNCKGSWDMGNNCGTAHGV